VRATAERHRVFVQTAMTSNDTHADNSMGSSGSVSHGGWWWWVAGGIFYGNDGKVGSEMLAWNVLGFLVIVAWTVLTTGITFGTLRLVGCLRVSDEILRSDFDRSESIDMHEHGESAYTSHMVNSSSKSSMEEGKFTSNPTFEP
jgi:ammonia channel protein AmtB